MATLLLAATLALVTAGCVTRKLFIRSEPPGAQVVLDGHLVGTTPYEEEFLSYGVRRLELRLPGHVRQVEKVVVERPWWQVFPISLFTDVLLPVDIVDDRAFDFALSPMVTMTREEAEAAAREAYARLEALRDAHRGEGAADEPAPGDGSP